MSTFLPPVLLQNQRFREWLDGTTWQSSFNRRSVQRGKAYAQQGSVLSVSIDGGADAPIKIVAVVAGSRSEPYEVDVEMFPCEGVERNFWQFDTECSCPVGEGCKHGVAVIEKVKMLFRETVDQGELFEVTTIPELGREAALWLSSLRDSAEATPPAARKPTDEFLVYCIEPWDSYREEEAFRLVMRTASRKRDGEVRIKDSEAQANPVKPARYMAPEDLPLAAMIHKLQGPYGEVHLEGPGWTQIISSALELGRLYYGQAGDGYRKTGAHDLLELGPAVEAETGWRPHSDGSAEPVVILGNPEQFFLPTEPALYLHPESHHIGPVQADVSSVTLRRWGKGPTIASSEMNQLGEAIARMETSVSLPLPIQMPLEHLEGLAPVPHLRLRRYDAGGYDDLETIIGELTFQYGDHPPFFPLTGKAPERESWLGEGIRYILDRDRKKERVLEKSLHQSGLSPLHEVFYPRDLERNTLHAVIVTDPFPSLSSAWLGWLEEEAPGFREQGWIIEVDPDSGLVVHDFTAFAPALEADPDHGIDWFTFDLQGSFGEHTTSLIPYIAGAIAGGLPALDDPELPEHFILPGETIDRGQLRIPARAFLELCHQVAHLFHGRDNQGEALSLDRLAAAGVADTLAIDDSETTRTLAALGRRLQDIRSLPKAKVPARLKADLRPYQLAGFRWLRFLAEHGLHGILADDMGLGKTVQTLASLAVRKRGALPSLVIAPTSVVGNWAAEAARFVPGLKVLVLQGSERKGLFDGIPKADLVLTSYPLLTRDHEVLLAQDWDTVVLDEAQYIKNPKTAAAQRACELKAAHRLCLSGTPMENHLGELWSLMRFLMPGLLGDEKSFSSTIRRPIERHQNKSAQVALNRRIAPLILRRTKDEVAPDLPPKTEIIHAIDLGKKEVDLYESVRAAMDKRVREALVAKGLAKSHIIVLDALLKLRQICCHPTLLKTPAAQKLKEGSKLTFLTQRLLPELVAEGRRILLFSQFTSMLALIEKELKAAGTPYLKLTGRTQNRAALVKQFQEGNTPVFLISLKAGGTGLNLTAADTVIHYDPWWNPATEAQATDRAHRIGQTKPVFVHKLICQGSIENRILELQEHKSALVNALLSEETTKLKIDPETLSHLFAPLA